MIALPEGLPTSAIDFSDPVLAEAPFPSILSSLRDLGPVVYHERLMQYMVTTHQDCKRVLGNARNFFTPKIQNHALFGGETIFSMDLDRHDRIRGIWAPRFARPSIGTLRPMISGIVAANVKPFTERVRAGESMEALSGMIRAIPTLVIARLIGVPENDIGQFSSWSDEMVLILQGVINAGSDGAEMVSRGSEATAELNGYIHQVISDSAGRPDADLIGHILASPVRNEMTEWEVVAAITQLVFAGNETTAKLMANTLYALAQHPDQRRVLAGNRSQIPQAIEEIHRWLTVTQVNWRIARNAADIGGHPLNDGATVLVMQGLANRDPARWETPDELDISRELKSHLGFGFGMHSCLGMNLARLETEIWLDQMLDYLPDWEVSEVAWDNMANRGPSSINVSR